jgi:hypothetical protein
MNDEIKLAPPGAGLPTLERLLSEAFLLALRGLLSKAALSRWLRSETTKAIAAVASLPAPLDSYQVLVDRPTGLEDSSRHWSANMVLQHLVIVTDGIHDLALALGRNHGFEREVRIAEVKPVPGAGPEQRALLQAAVERYVSEINVLGDLRSAGRHEHPWFGALDLRGWHALAAMHAFAHRRQIEQIIRLAR